MPQPDQGSVHVDRVLTNISVAYIQNNDHYIADKVFPIVPVDKQSDLYFVYTKNDWFRDEAQRRPDATESAGGGYNLSTASYQCDVWAFHKDIGAQTRKNSDMPLNPDRDATTFVTQRLLLRREVQWVADYFTTSVWATDVTPTALWSDFIASDPIEDVELGKETILKNTGFMPNTLTLGYPVFRKLRNHPDFVDRLKYTTTESVTAEIMAKLFDVDRVLVAKAVKATNVEGATGAYDFTHGKHALLTYSAPAPGLLMPSAGYMMSWRGGVSAGLGLDIGISSFWMQKEKADRVEGEIAFDDKVVATDLGYFFNGAVA